MDLERIIAAAFIVVGVLVWVAVHAWDRYKFVAANAPVGADTIALFGPAEPTPIYEAVRFEFEARAEIEGMTGGAR